MNLVEELARKRKDWEGAELPFHPGYEEARWWINAIAAAVEAEDAKFSNDTPFATVARWLRAEAKR